MAPESLVRLAQMLAGSSGKTIAAGMKTRDPEVAKRRALAKTNLDAPASELCQIFDREKVPLPSKWQAAGFTSWVRVYRHPDYRSRIDVLGSKDRRSDRR